MYVNVCKKWLVRPRCVYSRVELRRITVEAVVTVRAVYHVTGVSLFIALICNINRSRPRLIAAIELYRITAGNGLRRTELMAGIA